MRNLIVLTFVSLDGVMQAPGGPEEDTSGGFKFGGWTWPYADGFFGRAMSKQMGHRFDLLLGRKTYDIFAAYWPKQRADHPVAVRFNPAAKYVVSHQPLKLSWEHSELISDNVPASIAELKRTDGPELQVHGSSNLIQTLLKHDLVDELWLKIFPVTLGTGKRLFGDGTIPATWELTESSVSPKGVIFANYCRAGELKTGSLG